MATTTELKQALADVARQARKAIELIPPPPPPPRPAAFQGEIQDPPAMPAHQIERIRAALRSAVDVIEECLGNRPD
jgi:hypothetical protein